LRDEKKEGFEDEKDLKRKGGFLGVSKRLDTGVVLVL
jgi:hypothetical protein